MVDCPAQTAEVSERLPDGSLIVRVDGREYRAVTVEQMRALDKLEREHELLTQLNQKQKELIAGLQQQIAVMEKQQQAYEQQLAVLKQLQETADRLARKSRVQRFFDSSVGQILFRGVIPAVLIALTSR